MYVFSNKEGARKEPLLKKSESETIPPQSKEKQQKEKEAVSTRLWIADYTPKKTQLQRNESVSGFWVSYTLYPFPFFPPFPSVLNDRVVHLGSSTFVAAWKDVHVTVIFFFLCSRIDAMHNSFSISMCAKTKKTCIKDVKNEWTGRMGREGLIHSHLAAFTKRIMQTKLS